MKPHQLPAWLLDPGAGAGGGAADGGKGAAAAVEAEADGGGDAAAGKRESEWPRWLAPGAGRARGVRRRRGKPPSWKTNQSRTLPV